MQRGKSKIRVQFTQMANGNGIRMAAGFAWWYSRIYDRQIDRQTENLNFIPHTMSTIEARIAQNSLVRLLNTHHSNISDSREKYFNLILKFMLALLINCDNK